MQLAEDPYAAMMELNSMMQSLEPVSMSAVSAATEAAVETATSGLASSVQSRLEPLEGQLQRLAARLDVIEAERSAAALEASASVVPIPPEEEYDPDDDLADDELDLLEELGLDVSMVRRGRKEKEAAKEQSGT